MNHTGRSVSLDVAYYRTRLADPNLADKAVAVEIAPGEYEAAVPCGPGRDAGQVTVLDLELARVAVENLAGCEGFPGVRHGTPEPEHQAWPVEWGTEVLPPPRCGHLHCLVDHHYRAGRRYGYSDSALEGHIGRITLAHHLRLPDCRA